MKQQGAELAGAVAFVLFALHRLLAIPEQILRLVRSATNRKSRRCGSGEGTGGRTSAWRMLDVFLVHAQSEQLLIVEGGGNVGQTL